MRITWNFLRCDKKCFATLAEQKSISEGTGLPMKPIYRGDEVEVIIEWATQEIKKGNLIMGK